ncbi:hypothetical protein V2J09_010809 [Rumex salicifolius]
MRHSVNRPPTPDESDEQEKEPTLQEIINIKLVESGEKERLMDLLRERLIECGWKDEMRALCRELENLDVRLSRGVSEDAVAVGEETQPRGRRNGSGKAKRKRNKSFFLDRRLSFVKKKGRNNVTVDDLVHVITPKGRGKDLSFSIAFMLLLCICCCPTLTS